MGSDMFSYRYVSDDEENVVSELAALRRQLRKLADGPAIEAISDAVELKALQSRHTELADRHARLVAAGAAYLAGVTAMRGAALSDDAEEMRRTIGQLASLTIPLRAAVEQG